MAKTDYIANTTLFVRETGKTIPPGHPVKLSDDQAKILLSKSAVSIASNRRSNANELQSDEDNK